MLGLGTDIGSVQWVIGNDAEYAVGTPECNKIWKPVLTASGGHRACGQKLMVALVMQVHHCGILELSTQY